MTGACLSLYNRGMAKRGWYSDWLDSMERQDSEARILEVEIRREQERSELDEDGCYSDGSREDEPGHGHG